MGKFMKTIALGMVIGATAEMMMMPHYDRKTKRKIKRAGHRMRNVMEDTYDSIHSLID